MGSDKQTGDANSGTRWTATQTYVTATVCLLIGLAVGYLLRGSATASSTRPTETRTQPAMHEGNPAAAGVGQVTPDQLKLMGDKQVEPMLAALQKDPNNADLLAQVATAYFRAQQFPAAAEYYERAVKIRPNSEVLVSLANSYHYAGADDKAIETLNRALQVDPKSANALFNLGILKWQAKNDPKGAIDAWQQLLKSNPNHPRRAQVEEMIAKAKQHMNMPAGTKTDKPVM
jgi:cytochrome c-type biogenesis protein CcmH/NrfG